MRKEAGRKKEEEKRKNNFTHQICHDVMVAFDMLANAHNLKTQHIQSSPFTRHLNEVPVPPAEGEIRLLFLINSNNRDCLSL